MSNGYARILSAVYGSIWAMQPEKLDAMFGLLELKAAGGGSLLEPQVIEAFRVDGALQAARAKTTQQASTGSVAVLPLYGMIMQRASMVGGMSAPSGTSVEQFKAQFRAAINDPKVKALVIDVDSPGGTVAAVDELTTEMFKARAQGKKVVAVSNCLCASAAYYIASAANEMVASPSSSTGSIGVYAALRDDTQMLEKMGVKYTIVTHGENKAAGDPRQPTSQAAIDELQQAVTAFGQMFDRAVARNRGIGVEQVRKTFGQGKTFMAADAKAIGMVDRVATLDDVLADFGIAPLSMSLSAAGTGGRALAAAGAEDDPEAARIRQSARRLRELELAGA